ncbi:hypothetical protein [Anaerotruncus colihominis]
MGGLRTGRARQSRPGKRSVRRWAACAQAARAKAGQASEASGGE